jgi:hypothetical protein
MFAAGNVVIIQQMLEQWLIVQCFEGVPWTHHFRHSLKIKFKK